jgi:IS30 family transposase
MPKIYTHLTIQERAVIMIMRDDQCSIRFIAKRLCSAPSSISRELQRTLSDSQVCDANLTHWQNEVRRLISRRRPKLEAGGVLFQVVRHYLNLLWSPQQISHILKGMWYTESDKNV